MKKKLIKCLYFLAGIMILFLFLKKNTKENIRLTYIGTYCLSKTIHDKKINNIKLNLLESGKCLIYINTKTSADTIFGNWRYFDDGSTFQSEINYRGRWETLDLSVSGVTFYNFSNKYLCLEDVYFELKRCTIN